METTRTYTTAENPTDHQPDERDLIVRAQEGDMDATGMLCESHRSDWEQQARGHVGSREDAEDVAQETCIRVLRRITAFEDEGKGIGPYAWRAVSNLCIDRAR